MELCNDYNGTHIEGFEIDYNGTHDVRSIIWLDFINKE